MSSVLTALHTPLAMAALAAGRATMANWMNLIVEVDSSDMRWEAMNCDVLMVKEKGHQGGIYVVPKRTTYRLR